MKWGQQTRAVGELTIIISTKELSHCGNSYYVAIYHSESIITKTKTSKNKQNWNLLLNIISLVLWPCFLTRTLLLAHLLCRVHSLFFKVMAGDKWIHSLDSTQILEISQGSGYVANTILKFLSQDQNLLARGQWNLGIKCSWPTRHCRLWLPRMAITVPNT